MRGWLWLVLLFAACKPRPEAYHRLELPGFSLETPDFVQTKPGLAYREDDLDGERGLTAVSISWSVGELSEPNEFGERVNLVIEALAKGEKVQMMPARKAKVGGQDAVRVDGKVNILDITIVDIACGTRTITMQITGTSIEDLRERVLASFSCKPDPKQESQTAVAPVPVGLDDRSVLAGFRYTDDDRTMLSITNDKLLVVFHGVTGISDEPELMRTLLPQLLKSAGEYRPDAARRETRKGPKGIERTYQGGWLEIDGESHLVISSIWTCDEKNSVVAYAVVLDKAIQQGPTIDGLNKFRCAEPNDAPLAIAPATE